MSWQNWGSDNSGTPPSLRNPKIDGKNKDWASKYLRERHINQNPNGKYDPNANLLLPCRPNLPFKMATNGTAAGDRENGGGNNQVKTSDLSNFIESYVLTQPNLSEEEAFAFAALTGNEILQTSYTSNYYTSNATLNDNIIDILSVSNSIKPIELIKLQKADSDYFLNTLFEYSYTIDTNTGIASVTIPKTGILPSFKVQIETFTPKAIKNATIY